MPSKKKAAKKPAKKPAKKHPTYQAPPKLSLGGRPCTPKDICEFLDKLSAYLQAFNVDYKALRVAVCNVEKQAFAGTGNPNRPPRFCSGGPGNEPADPPPPPVW